MNIYSIGRCNLAIPEVITSCANLTEIKSVRSSQCSISTEKSNLSNSLNPTSNVLNGSRSVQTLGNELSCLSEYSHESRDSRPCSITSKLELLERISRSSREQISPRTPVTEQSFNSDSSRTELRQEPERELVLADPNQSNKNGNDSADLDGISSDNGKIHVPSKLS